MFLTIVIAAVAAFAAAATSQMLRHHYEEVGGDFGSPAVAGPNAERRIELARW